MPEKSPWQVRSGWDMILLPGVHCNEQPAAGSSGLMAGDNRPSVAGYSQAPRLAKKCCHG